MSFIQCTRAERREMKRRGKLVDRATEADHLLFVRFPHRQHRSRLTSQTLIDQHELIDGKRPAAREEWVADPYRDAEARLRRAAGTRP